MKLYTKTVVDVPHYPEYICAGRMVYIEETNEPVPMVITDDPSRASYTQSLAVVLEKREIHPVIAAIEDELYQAGWEKGRQDYNENGVTVRHWSLKTAVDEEIYKICTEHMKLEIERLQAEHKSAVRRADAAEEKRDATLVKLIKTKDRIAEHNLKPWWKRLWRKV